MLAMLMVTMTIGCLTTSADGIRDTESGKLRLNYGVHFRPKKTVYAVSDFWAQVFVVKIPAIPTGNLSADVPDCSRLTIRACRTLRPMFLQMHNAYAQMTREIRHVIQHILNVLPADRDFGSSHTKRSLLPFGGWLLYGLFGTTTDNHLKPIKKQVTRISQGMTQVARGMEMEHKRLAGYMTLTNHRLDGLLNMTMNQNEAISNLAGEFNNQLGTTLAMEQVYSIMSNKMTEYTTILNQLAEFQLGIEMLEQGSITPVLIDKRELLQVLRSVREHLQNRYPRLYLLWNRVSDVYGAQNFIYGRKGQHLLIQTHLPVTPKRGHYTLFEVETFPVIVDDQTDHVTEIRNLPKYFVATERSLYYILPKHVPDDDKSPLLNLARYREPFRSFRYGPTCVSALFKDDRKLIHELCQFRIWRTTLKPSITFLTDTQVLFLNVTNATLTCGTENRQMKPCAMCLHHVDCSCILKLWSKGGQLQQYFTPKMATCDLPQITTDIRTVINLAVIQHFFNDTLLGRLSGSTLLDRKLQITLPKFKTYEHRFKELLASDQTDKYDLDKFAKRVKNDSRVYHHLAEVVADEMETVQDETFDNDS